MPASNAETVYLSTPEMLVTNRRLVLSDGTYPIAGITSIRSIPVAGINKWVLRGIAILGILLMFDVNRGVFGPQYGLLLLIAVCMFIWAVINLWRRDPRYQLIIGIGGNEKYTSLVGQRESIQVFVDAVSDALKNIHSGLVIEEIIMGDKFQNIKNSTILNNSLVENAFNSTKQSYGDDTAQALLLIADKVARSGNAAAGSLFNQFVSELQKPNREKSILSQFWDGLLKVLPDVATMTEAVSKIGKIITGG